MRAANGPIASDAACRAVSRSVRQRLKGEALCLVVFGIAAASFFIPDTRGGLTKAYTLLGRLVAAGA